MRDLARLVAGTITRHALAGADDRIAVAVSGGPDSVALVFLLREVAPDFGFTLAGLVHVNHLLRGAESDLLLESTVEQMRGRGPAVKTMEFPGIGHAPWLMSEDQIRPIADFLLP